MLSQQMCVLKRLSHFSLLGFMGCRWVLAIAAIIVKTIINIKNGNVALPLVQFLYELTLFVNLCASVCVNGD